MPNERNRQKFLPTPSKYRTHMAVCCVIPHISFPFTEGTHISAGIYQQRRKTTDRYPLGKLKSFSPPYRSTASSVCGYMVGSVFGCIALRSPAYYERFAEVFSSHPLAHTLSLSLFYILNFFLLIVQM